jgi:hypothetical protein
MRLGHTLRFLALTALCFGLSSCATSYQPVGTDATGGHSFRRLAEDVFEVEFRGNGFTEPKRAKDFATLRAAEVCREHNFRYFSLVGEGDNSRTDIVRTGGTSYTTGTVNAYGTFSGTTTTTATNIPIFKPRPSVTIKCYTTIPGGHAGPVRDADTVIRELRAKYKLDKRSS